MKNFSILLLVLGLTTGCSSLNTTKPYKIRAVSSFQSGSQCGLTDTFLENDSDSASETFDITHSARKVPHLPRIVREQILYSANFPEGIDGNFKNPKKAAEAIKEHSEGGELYILRATIKRKKYSVVSFYGGGNHTGFIFPWGKKVAVAEISDGDLRCLN